ncbi:MAG: hypothetical protein WC789_09315 [Lentisphaeria bacterium]
MADSTIDSELIIQYDNWPGPVEAPTFDVGDGFLDKRYHNVSIPAFPIGTKVQVKNVTLGKKGYATLIYLQVGTQDATTMVAKTACIPDSATLWYQLTNDPDSCIKTPTNLGCFAISAITNAYYGWFWEAGIVPEDALPGLGGNFVTNTAVVAGGWMFGASDAVVGMDIVDAAGERPAGFALADDAA